MTIADLSTVWMSSDVPEPSIRFVRVGEEVEITLVAFPGEVLRGRVARIADTLDAQTRTLKVHVELPNPSGRFRPEMFGSIRHAGSMRSLPVIPWRPSSRSTAGTSCSSSSPLAASSGARSRSARVAGTSSRF